MFLVEDFSSLCRINITEVVSWQKKQDGKLKKRIKKLGG